jgi:hypothetical protein
MTRVGVGERFAYFDEVTNLKKYYVQNNKIVLLDHVNSSNDDSLCMVFYIKPSKMVQEERVGVITGINTTTGQITLSSIPTNFNLNVEYDLYKAESPYNILKIDLSAMTINTTTKTITFNPDDLPSELQIGDHLALAGESIIPQVPTELHAMLAQLVACRVLEALSDTEGLQLAMVKLEQMRNAAGNLIDNRVDDSPKKIINRYSVVRTSVYSSRFSRRR